MHGVSAGGLGLSLTAGRATAYLSPLPPPFLVAARCAAQLIRSLECLTVDTIGWLLKAVSYWWDCAERSSESGPEFSVSQ